MEIPLYKQMALHWALVPLDGKTGNGRIQPTFASNA
jgi:hypothetical protein